MTIWKLLKLSMMKDTIVASDKFFDQFCAGQKKKKERRV